MGLGVHQTTKLHVPYNWFYYLFHKSLPIPIMQDIPTSWKAWANSISLPRTLALLSVVLSSFRSLTVAIPCGKVDSRYSHCPYSLLFILPLRLLTVARDACQDFHHPSSFYSRLHSMGIEPTAASSIISCVISTLLPSIEQVSRSKVGCCFDTLPRLLSNPSGRRPCC